MVESVETSSYICINCGSNVESLFRKYSSTVLKLTKCGRCHRTADKYVEYDVIILIIDLILLQQRAYRHILYNSNYKNLWKLSVIILLVDTYTDWTSSNKYFGLKKIQVDFDYNNFEFYKIGIKNAIRTFLFVLVVYLHTVLYCKTLKKPSITLHEVWKMLAISSFGTFFLLPVLIWDVGVHQEIHKFIIVVYIILSQLTAYMVLANGAKIWSIYTILFSYIFQTVIFDYYYNLIVTGIVEEKLIPYNVKYLIK
ncbi:hypothetical protein WA026_007254 [Henosepilachna vigintioctopunctata]|uniref:Protein ARV n=1 Tax=Henosepilachna vigintioctopunctata TaxID=420089 RepID=A0AAW1UNN7_9CUCU